VPARLDRKLPHHYNGGYFLVGSPLDCAEGEQS
jgi:hypothetical protein